MFGASNILLLWKDSDTCRSHLTASIHLTWDVYSVHHKIHRLLEPVFVCHLDRMRFSLKYINFITGSGSIFEPLGYVTVAEHWRKSDMLGFPWFPAETNDLVTKTSNVFFISTSQTWQHDWNAAIGNCTPQTMPKIWFSFNIERCWYKVTPQFITKNNWNLQNL